ncbi:MAG: osmotically inducible protein OsmC [Caldiserica bacterium CG02_land_8_20_14_3_00_36_38]|nr:OsmC family protein [Caldisericota bacterium]NCQ52913.1 OsmC family protein [Caldisericota bacterium]PIP49628.1 MAG: osmotically inducible protein OsmC [Caldiserica bacterium CG23_combo_of_CG06-09_8_20_14_all_35_60]PIV54580.1 MAG: osmotically inducible protein OsmC [Caldiserica bacterium CG02_land_8_20_14_3_00_36_38]PIX28437.1 MAG: osmotically inducible protein OsmC [Caldiserica bacterium CG_4_8_14_3_um_filter_35_18]
MGDKIKVELKQAYGMTVIAKANSNHWIVMDSQEESGGHNAGPRPMELILMGLAGCTGMDVISILNKMKVKYNDFRIEITAEKATEHPKVYTKIHLKYRIWGDVPEDKLSTAIELSRTKYCSVGAMLSKAAEITDEHEIIIH